MSRAKVTGTYVVDDWRTQGDFYGADALKNYRYGEWSARLCAVASPYDASWGRKGAACVGNLGSHHAKGDSIRNWVHWNKTDNPRSLKNPYLGYRRQAEWDDHGEAYPMSYEGPHLYVDIIMPKDAEYLAFYIFNKDGHDGMNRCRDYVITVKKYCADGPAIHSMRRPWPALGSRTSGVAFTRSLPCPAGRNTPSRFTTTGASIPSSAAYSPTRFSTRLRNVIWRSTCRASNIPSCPRRPTNW